LSGELPTGTVTFVFTDVEWSTRLPQQLGTNSYADALAEHRRALRQAFIQHDGVEVDTQDDSLFIAFSTAQLRLRPPRKRSRCFQPARSGCASVRSSEHPARAT
jgi:class 3 adenylate cyclase